MLINNQEIQCLTAYGFLSDFKKHEKKYLERAEIAYCHARTCARSLPPKARECAHILKELLKIFPLWVRFLKNSPSSFLHNPQHDKLADMMARYIFSQYWYAIHINMSQRSNP